MKIRLVVAAAALAALPFAACSATSASPAVVTGSDDRTSQSANQTLRYWDIRRSTQFLDLGRRGGDPTPGDAYFFVSHLRHLNSDDAVSRQSAGRFLSTCVFIADAQAKCSGGLILGGDTIEVAGTVDLSSTEPIAAAVVGGTGRFAGAAGDLTIRQTSRPNVSQLVVRLHDPR